MVPLSVVVGYFVAAVGVGFVSALVCEGAVQPVALIMSVLRRIFGGWV